jgi:lipocalin
LNRAFPVDHLRCLSRTVLHLFDNGFLTLAGKTGTRLSEINEWKKAEGKTYFVNNDSEGYLKVSFFGPFYGSYVIFELDHENYQYAFVSGPSTKYLWLLSRTPSVGREVVEKFIEMSKSRDFDTDELIFVQHN